ncbi:MarR family winged helix-turn-helix transcriptional regulator [Pseudoalteromonas denitrificans]|uniref:DNA-binding transcriptional regulator, MarR family n=1 Tax=Pseudoalteromonas denitrificans DSM 6059 TaxID=1123010 RepID=A0A1I1RCV3_9GAMM|nr:MarR family transcriptional regulator [Pseudoalteromonas denitrificans]SFD32062.1 DNA-binding transcriptional regulator, MarR family [Pseudoalteromonas denitrificans DSM 6059]
MNTDKQLNLDNQLCFALYSTSLAMTQLYKKHLSPLDLTYPQYTVMLILWEKDGLSLKTIADRLGQKSGSLTPVIKRMEADNLIKRVRGSEDDRSLSIELTLKGHTLKEQGKHVNQCVAQTCGIAIDEITTLKEQLVKLRKNLLK